jgi:hypothetical protein
MVSICSRETLDFNSVVKIVICSTAVRRDCR